MADSHQKVYLIHCFFYEIQRRVNSSIVAMPTLSSSPFLSLRRPHAEAVLFPFTTSTFTAPVNYTVADRGRGDSLFV
uniref:Uncharacterized protein n=1 Tax=Caenorhabditis japonica TaxID=281687 RepID=A0A8R1I9R1_CAEJA